MSTRNFNQSGLGLGGEAVEVVRFAFLDLAGDPQFLHSSVGVITWGGEDWYGVGSLCNIEPIRDALGLSPTRVRLTLAGAVFPYLNDALNENTWGRLAEIYMGTYDGGSLTRDPELEIRGRLGPPEVVIGSSGARISVMVEDIRAALSRVNGLRCSMLDHQVEAPNDTFYALLPKMLDHKFVFNGQPIGGYPMPSGSAGGYDNWGPPSGPILP